MKFENVDADDRWGFASQRGEKGAIRGLNSAWRNRANRQCRRTMKRVFSNGALKSQIFGVSTDQWNYRMRRVQAEIRHGDELTCHSCGASICDR